jgi:hypothetical protein
MMIYKLWLLWKQLKHEKASKYPVQFLMMAAIFMTAAISNWC